ncbi:uncharacterized protein [Ptychodera flava]|uniref:uncharacterized protein isoform X2 n=1 Tax=Ptychodera flava TaxID=63121 RepID=UPI00396A7294
MNTKCITVPENQADCAINSSTADDCAVVGGESNPSNGYGAKTQEKPDEPCQVCGDQSSGYHLGAYACEACKKFFIRSTKPDKSGNCVKYTCTKDKKCVINKQTRTQCQYCRLQKCSSVGMARKGARTAESKPSTPVYAGIPCQVCGAESSGFHFGAITCEGCKGFFRRTIKERDSEHYVCQRDKDCEINSNTRNTCRYCRYKKCLSVGMSVEGSRIGRQPIHIRRQLLKGNINLIQQSHHQNAQCQTDKVDVIEKEVLQPGPPTSDSSDRPLPPETEVCNQEDLQHTEVSVSRASDTVALHKTDDAGPVQDQLTPVSRPKMDSSERCRHQQHINSKRNTHNVSGETEPTTDFFIERPLYHQDGQERYQQSSQVTMATSRGTRQLNTSTDDQLYTQQRQARQSENRSSQSVMNTHLQSQCQNLQKPNIPLHLRKTACQHYNSQLSANETQAVMDWHPPNSHPPPSNAMESHARPEPNVFSDMHGPRSHPNCSKLISSHNNPSSHQTPMARHFTQQNLSCIATYHPKNYIPFEDDFWARDDHVPCIKFTEVIPVDQDYDYNANQSHDEDLTEELLFRMQPSNKKRQYVREYTWETRHALLPRQPKFISSTYEQNIPVYQQSRREFPFTSGSFISISHPLTPNYMEEAPVVTDEMLVADPQVSTLIQNVLTAAHELEPIKCESPSIPNLTEGPITTAALWEKLMKLFSKHIHCVLGFAKKLPVVTVLAQDYSKMEMTYSYFSMTEEERQKVILIHPKFDALSSQMETFGEILSPLKLDNIESALLSALQLIATDWPGLKDRAPIEKLQDKICSALEKYCFVKRSEGYDRFGMILTMIPQLRRFSSIHHDCVLQLQQGIPNSDLSQLWNETLYSDCDN